MNSAYYERLHTLFTQHHMPEACRDLELLQRVLIESIERSPYTEDCLLRLRDRVDAWHEGLLSHQWQLLQMQRDKYRRLERAGCTAVDVPLVLNTKKRSKKKSHKAAPKDASNDEDTSC